MTSSQIERALFAVGAVVLLILIVLTIGMLSATLSA